MAFESIGLGAVLSFDAGNAIAGIRRSSGAFSRLMAKAAAAGAAVRRAGAGMRTVGRGIGQLGRGASNAAVAMAPLAIATGLAGKQAANFEQAMANVGAVLLKTPSQMGPLIAKAKELGASTTFSATEVGQAMENMARAGFAPKEIIASIGGVLNAAAADGLDLAQAANIVSGAIRGMGLQAKDAAGASNVLALVSSKSRTNIAALGQGLRFTMAQARTMQIRLPQLTAALGVASDSLGATTITGTSLTQMLVKLTKPAGEAKSIMKKWGVSAKFSADGQLDLARTLAQYKTNLDQITDPIERARVQTTLFGIRGQKAFGALISNLPKLTSLTASAEGQMTKLNGAAGKMARIRLATTRGAFTLLKSALEGLAIEVMGPLLAGTASWIRGFTTGLSSLVKGVQALSTKGGKLSEKFTSLSPTMQAVALGVSQGITQVKSALSSLSDRLGALRERFGSMLPPDTLTKLVALATKVALLAPVVLGAGLAFKGLSFALSGVLGPALSGVKLIATGLFSAFGGPGLIAVGALAAALVALRTEAAQLAGGFLEGVGVGSLGELWTTTVTAMRNAWDAFAGAVKSGVAAFGIDWKDLGKDIGVVVRAIVDSIGWIIDKWNSLSPTTRKVIAVIGMLLTPVGIVAAGVLGVVKAWQLLKAGVSAVAGAVSKATTSISNALNAYVLAPLQKVWGKVSSVVTLFAQAGRVIWGVAVRVGQIIIGKIVGALRTVFSWFSPITDAVLSMGGTVVGVARSIVAWIGGKVSAVLKTLHDWWGKIAAAAAGAWNSIKGAAFKVLNLIKSGINNLVVLPLRNMASIIVKAADAVEVEVPKGLREFAAGGALEVGLSSAASRAAAAVQAQATVPSGNVFGSLTGLTQGLAGKATAGMKALGAEIGKAAGANFGKQVGAGMGKMADAMAKQPCVETSVEVDGKEVARATSKVATEASARGAWKATPWQMRMAAEQGAIPA